MPAASPSFRPLTPGPRAAITPAPSWPGINGSGGLPAQSPSAACRSVWQTPVAMTLMRTSPGPGVGIGTSSIVRGLPNACTTPAFIVVAMLASPTACGQFTRPKNRQERTPSSAYIRARRSVGIGGAHDRTADPEASDDGSRHQLGFSFHSNPAELADELDQLAGFLLIDRHDRNRFWG